MQVVLLQSRLWMILWRRPMKACGRLEAAESIDVAEMISQLEAAAESSRKLRHLVSSELPDASWENREELDEIIERNPEKFNGTNAEKVNASGNKWYLPVRTLGQELIVRCSLVKSAHAADD